MFVLRCYRVAVAPLVAYCVLLWGVGLAGGYALAYQDVGPWTAQHSPPPSGPPAPWRWPCSASSCQLILWRAVRSYRPAAG